MVQKYGYAETPEGFEFVPGTDEIVPDLLAKADDPTNDVVAYPGYGFFVKKGLAKKAGLKPVDGMETDAEAPSEPVYSDDPNTPNADDEPVNETGVEFAKPAQPAEPANAAQAPTDDAPAES